MANHKSSEKRIRQTVAKRAHNRLFHKTARNAVKALRNTTDKSAAEALLPKVTGLSIHFLLFLISFINVFYNIAFDFPGIRGALIV